MGVQFVSTDLTSSGVLNNSTIGSIRGGQAAYANSGVAVELDGGSIVNKGAIYGGYAKGSASSSGFTAGAGIDFTGAGTIKNYGITQGGQSNSGNGGAAVTLNGSNGGVTLTNEGSGGDLPGGMGLIRGGFGAKLSSTPGVGGDGVDLSNQATLVNDGKIYGGPVIGAGIDHYAGAGVALFGTANANATDEPGGSNSGTIGGGYSSHWGLHAGDGLKIANATFTNTGTIMGGVGSSGGSTSGNGVDLNAATVTNSGTLAAGAADGAPTMGQAVYFGSLEKSTLVLQDGSKLTGDIGGFAQSDIIKVSGTIAETPNSSGSHYSVATPDGTLYFDGSFAGEHFVQTSLGAGVTEIQLEAGAACYLRGTRIRAAQGEVPIERLGVGDRVLTASGDFKAVRWLGRRKVDCSRYPRPADVWPIRIRAGAFADDLPLRDLWVSPGHALEMGGALIQVEKLVNGATIVQEPQDLIEYWHLELDRHDLVLAEGLAAETYLDTGNRSAFENGADHLELYPDFRAKHWKDTCLPLVLEGPELERAKAITLARASELGFLLTAEDDVHLVADGKRIEPRRLAVGRLAFVAPATAKKIEFYTRTFTPAQVDGASADARSLGLCVARVQLDDREIDLDDAGVFAHGWHPIERDASGRAWRWTQGSVRLPRGIRLVVIELAGGGCYWERGASTVSSSALRSA